MRLLVTGGAGFIGSNFCRMFDKKYDITVLDALTYCGRRDNLDGVKHKFVRGDIRNKKLVETLMKKTDVVLHCAAATHVDRSITNPKEFVSTDVLGTATLLEAARKNGVKRFVHISTDEVYGPAIKTTFDEDAHFRPSSPYSASKAGADLLCQAYHKTYGFPVVIARPSNNYGAFQNPEKAIPRFIILALQNKPLPLFRPGHQLRQWICVDDCCRAIELLLRKGKSGEAYNIGGGDRIKNIDLANMILKRISTSSKVQMIENRKGHDWAYSIDDKKIRDLGWSPKTKFKDGLARTIMWYWLNTPWWSKCTKDKFVDFGDKK